MVVARKSCCILGCSSVSRRKLGFSEEGVKFYKFPDSVFGAEWKIFKRNQWINAVKNYVDNSKDWMPKNYTRICSTHFVNNVKSEHPLHPSYIPSIFPCRNNIKRNVQSLERFERMRRRGKIKNDVKIENMMETIIKIEEHPIDICAETLSVKFTQRSISCQTEEISDGADIGLAYFFCNLNCINNLSTAAVQVNLPITKIKDEI